MKNKIKKNTLVDKDSTVGAYTTLKIEKKRVISTPSKERTKFRATTEWKNFKTSIIKARGLRCECCGRYTKTLTLHHRNMDKTQYTNISDSTHFSLLCLSCHQSVHHFHTQVNKKKATPTQMIIDFIKPFFVTP